MIYKFVCVHKFRSKCATITSQTEQAPFNQCHEVKATGEQ